MARDRNRVALRTPMPARDAHPGLSIEELAEVIALMRTNDIEEIQIEREADAMMLHLVRPASVAAEVRAPDGAASDVAMEAPVASPHADRVAVVQAQLVGKFHVGTQPGARLAFEIGEKVKRGQTLGTIETLGSFIEVEAPVSGTIATSEVAEGDTVEYGQELLSIESAEIAESTQS